MLYTIRNLATPFMTFVGYCNLKYTVYIIFIWTFRNKLSDESQNGVVGKCAKHSLYVMQISMQTSTIVTF